MPAPLSLPRLCRALLALLGALLAQPLCPATEAPAKDHSLFVGLDVAVARKGKYYRVIGAEKNAVLIMLDHKVTAVPLAEAKDLRIDPGVKLTNLNASIANLRGDRGASRLQSNAEMEAMTKSMALQDISEDHRENVLGAARVASMALGNTAEGREAMAKALAQMPEIETSIARAAQNGTDLATGKSAAGGGGLNDTGFEVSFAVSTPSRLENCHLAVVVDYTLPGESNLPLSNVTLEPLGALGPEARKFTCQVRGFPASAELQGYRIAVYSHGQEIATNLSARRTEISRDDAITYLTLDYLAKHPGETRPPAPILMIPRSEFVARLGSAPLDQVIYARVGKDGKIIRLSTDVTGAVHLPSDLNSAFEPVGFVPALEKGKPVEGVAKLRLADLVASN